MPNAHLPGLPNWRSYDTTTEGVVIDHVTGLMWQRTVAPIFSSAAEAESQCRSLVLAGHGDWRLPSRVELITLLDSSRTEPSIDVDAFPLTPSDWYWTASFSSEDASAGWYVYFYFGYPDTDDRSARFSFRCVRDDRRAGETAATHYRSEGGTIVDAWTGLRWQREIAPMPMSFDAAREYCRTLDVASGQQWRVPTLVELLSIIDERAAAPKIDGVVFPDTPAEEFWTSSTFENGDDQAWYVEFARGSALYELRPRAFRVRCVS